MGFEQKEPGFGYWKQKLSEDEVSGIREKLDKDIKKNKVGKDDKGNFSIKTANRFIDPPEFFEPGYGDEEESRDTEISVMLKEKGDSESMIIKTDELQGEIDKLRYKRKMYFTGGKTFNDLKDYEKKVVSFLDLKIEEKEKEKDQLIHIN